MLVLAQLYFTNTYTGLAVQIAHEIEVRVISNSFDDITKLEYVNALVGLDDLQEVINFVKADEIIHFRLIRSC